MLVIARLLLGVNIKYFQQAAVYESVQSLSVTQVSGLPSLVMVDLADYATLAYYAAFTVEDTVKSTSPPKHVTYIALSKKTMPRVVELCESFKSDPAVYNDGTIEHVLSVSNPALRPLL